MRDVDWGRMLAGILTLSGLTLWIIGSLEIPWFPIRCGVLGLLCFFVAAVVVKASED